MAFGFGARAEARAAKLLRARGYRIVAKNYRCTVGEIDLIARRAELLVFVEVKARARATFGDAASAVDAEKQRRITAAAQNYLLRNPHEGDIRFDVVALTGDDVLVIEDAFRP